MSNPVFNKNSFKRVAIDESKMTIQGTIFKTLFLLTMVIASASMAKYIPIDMMISVLIAFMTGCIISFVPQLSKYLAVVYAIFEGIAIGKLSAIYAYHYNGIVYLAVMITFGIFLIFLGLYSFKIVRLNDIIKDCVITATAGIAFIYVIDIALMFCGANIPMIHSSGIFGIGFSLFVVGVASFNLFIDFEMVERCCLEGYPKYMEWYCGFGIMVTLIWLYLEILDLLRKLKD